MTMPLTLPLRTCPSFFRSETQSFIDAVCTPLDEAREGDIVGLNVGYTKTHGHVLVLPVVEFFTLKEVGSYQFYRSRYLDLPEDQREEISDAMMMLQSHGLYSPFIEKAIDTIDMAKDEPVEYFNALVLPNMALITRDGYFRNVFEVSHCGQASQSAVEAAMLAIYTKPLETAHERIEALSSFNQILDIVNANAPTPSPEDFSKNGRLTLPHRPDIPSL
jgi:hypothetical protein